jgi:predicted phage terminase large subunit-like protein
MPSAIKSWTTSLPKRWLSGLQLAQRKKLTALRSADAFIEFCFTDPLGRALRQATVHRELQAFLSAQRKALIELPRDHGKSVQVCGRIIWELGHNPALRVKLVCATEALAVERSRYLREALADNPRVRLIFPDLRPARPWTASAFTVARPANVIGPSVAAFGIGAGSTGARADLLVCDDIVDVRSLHSRASRERVADYFHNNLMNLLEPDGRFWGLFTPWHPDDLNSRLKKNPAFAHFRRAIGADLSSVWPEKWSPQRLAERLAEIGAASFARGYRLVPIDESETAIRPEWVKLWQRELPREAFELVILSVDPAVSAKATADASALVVLGRVSDGNEVRCLEAVARRLAAPELVNAIDDCNQRWRPDVILFESNAAFEAVRALLVRHARFGAKVKGETQSRSKEARIAAFSVPVQNGAFQLKGDADSVDAGQRELFEEMIAFPFGAHDDLLDAAATGTAYLLRRPDPRVWI